ncbi:MAG: nucleoside deaminase [Deltaproteobacteria bacterium]|nr:nucleoside deaminase [Deltaproteobacteria bacterium]
MTDENVISFRIPPWVAGFLPRYVASTNIDDRMSFVIEATRRNVIEKTGGPFAAAIFERDGGKLVSLGVNLVATENLCILHAEIVAIAVAQRALGTFDLGQEGLPPHELVTSSEPCAMCFGAVPWSGVRRLVAGARDADVRKIGFDEGAKTADWRAELEKRGIETIVDVRRDMAVGVLNGYAAQGGAIYGARGTGPSG